MRILPVVVGVKVTRVIRVNTYQAMISEYLALSEVYRVSYGTKTSKKATKGIYLGLEICEFVEVV